MVVLAPDFGVVERICKKFRPWNRIFHLHNGNPKVRKLNAFYPRMVSGGAGGGQGGSPPFLG